MQAGFVPYHPFQRPTILIPGVTKAYGMSGGFFDDLGDTLWEGVTGLTDALQGAINDTIAAVEAIGETIALIVRACMGDVSWSAVLDEIGVVFQHIGSAMVLLDPTNQLTSWLSTSKLTAHIWGELDKFSGGVLTNVNNISTLVGRVLRGDAIKTNELIKDALFVIEVVVIILTFPEGLVVAGVMMIGKNVCAKQTEAKDACMIAFEIVALALGNWAADWAASGEEAAGNSLEAEFENLPVDGSIEDAYDLVEAQAGDAAEEGAADTIAPYFSDAANQIAQQQGISIVTREANLLCQQNQWAGRNECNILSQVLNDYLRSDDETDWPEFLATEAGKIGAQQLLYQWFPPLSPEAIALKRRIVRLPTTINYIDSPSIIGQPSFAAMNPWTIVILAAGAAAALIGGGT